MEFFIVSGITGSPTAAEAHLNVMTNSSRKARQWQPGKSMCRDSA
jgi:hypothetical protein